MPLPPPLPSQLAHLFEKSLAVKFLSPLFRGSLSSPVKTDRTQPITGFCCFDVFFFKFFVFDKFFTPMTEALQIFPPGHQNRFPINRRSPNNPDCREFCVGNFIFLFYHYYSFFFFFLTNNDRESDEAGLSPRMGFLLFVIGTY